MKIKKAPVIITLTNKNKIDEVANGLQESNKLFSFIDTVLLYFFTSKVLLYFSIGTVYCQLFLHILVLMNEMLFSYTNIYIYKVSRQIYYHIFY